MQIELHEMHNDSLAGFFSVCNFQPSFFIKNSMQLFYIGRYHNLKNGKEASEVTEGKSSMMRWGR